jgi:hypothetical protein
MEKETNNTAAKAGRSGGESRGKSPLADRQRAMEEVIPIHIHPSANGVVALQCTFTVIPLANHWTGMNSCSSYCHRRRRCCLVRGGDATAPRTYVLPENGISARNMLLPPALSPFVASAGDAADRRIVSLAWLAKSNRKERFAQTKCQRRSPLYSEITTIYRDANSFS